MELVNILWTGGLDSTYRIVELSLLPIRIQPFYILDNTRLSTRYELKAMKIIASQIKCSPRTKAKLLDLKMVNKLDICEDVEITKAWTVLNKKYNLGIQYDFIARFAKQYKLKLEVGLEKSERSKAANAINSETSILLEDKKIEDMFYSVYVIDLLNSSNEGKLLFKDILLPATLWNMTKLDEIEGFKKLGYRNMVRETWFCHNPVLGLPCGHCNPCKDCLNEGLAFRIPKLGYLLGYIRKIIHNIYHRKI